MKIKHFLLPQGWGSWGEKEARQAEKNSSDRGGKVPWWTRKCRESVPHRHRTKGGKAGKFTSKKKNYRIVDLGGRNQRKRESLTS